MRSKACRLLGESGVEVVPFNDVGIEGFDAVCRIAFDLRLAMPRPRNVLVPSLKASILRMNPMLNCAAHTGVDACQEQCKGLFHLG